MLPFSTVLSNDISQMTSLLSWTEFRELLIRAMKIAGYGAKEHAIRSVFTEDHFDNPRLIIPLLEQWTGLSHDTFKGLYSTLNNLDRLQGYASLLTTISADSTISAPLLSRGLRTEGDSLMAGAYGNTLHLVLATLANRTVKNTAVGGSTMDSVLARVKQTDNYSYLGDVTIFWDGSQNGLTTVTAYVDLLQEAIEKLGHDRFVVIPPINPYGSTYAGGQAEQVYQEMAARWPDNLLHWNQGLPNTDNSIDADQFEDAGVDNYHMSAAGCTNMASLILGHLVEKGWHTPDEDDVILADGSVWLFDVTQGPFDGIPGDTDILPNVAWEKAAALIGSGNATTLGTYVELVDTNSGADITAERTSKGGFHSVPGQSSAYVGTSNQGFKLIPEALIQAYLDGNYTDDWYFSVWYAVTRPHIDPPGGNPATNGAPQSLMNRAGNTSNYLFYMSSGAATNPPVGAARLGNISLPSSSLDGYDEVTLGQGQLRAIATTAYTGTFEAYNSLGNPKTLGVCLGSQDAWDYFNNGAAPSIILYRAYAEHLTASGRDWDQVAALDRAMYKAAFAPGGRFYQDTYTDPNILLPA